MGLSGLTSQRFATKASLKERQALGIGCLKLNAARWHPGPSKKDKFGRPIDPRNPALRANRRHGERKRTCSTSQIENGAMVRRRAKSMNKRAAIWLQRPMKWS